MDSKDFIKLYGSRAVMRARARVWVVEAATLLLLSGIFTWFLYDCYELMQENREALQYIWQVLSEHGHMPKTKS